MTRSEGRAPGIAGLRVLEAGNGISTAIVGRLFHAAGAHVLRIAKAGPDPFAALYPSLSCWARDWETVAAHEAGTRLDSIDVLVVGGEDHPDAHPPFDVEIAEVAARHPRLVVARIAGYVPGTVDTTPAVDLLVQARTGLAFEQFTDQPTQIAFAPTVYGAGLLATIGAWAALHHRRATGRGQLVDVSLEQGEALFWPHLWLAADRPDAAFLAVPPRDVRHLIFSCADGGHIQFVLGVPGALAKVHAVLGIPGPVDPDDRGAPRPERGPEHYFADRDLLARYVATFPRDALVKALAAVGIAAEPVLVPGMCWDDEQVRAAGLIVADEQGREHVAAPIEMACRPVADPRPPLVATGTVGAGHPPLAGVRVVDLGNWVAGPFASKLLADLGADVISVEPPTGLSHLTGLRNTWASNRGKRSICVDLKTPAGRDILKRVVATADAVHHNFRPGVAERLGVDAVSLRESRPDLVSAHTTAYGQTGPKARSSGFDMVMQALCGHEARAGGRCNEPVWYRTPFVDYGAGALGAVGLLSALYEQAENGVAVDVHTSLLAAAMFVRGEMVRDPDGCLRGMSMLAGDRRGFHPAEALYRGRDGWIAVAARGQRMADALLAALGLRSDRSVVDWSTEEHDAIAAATSTWGCDELLTRLRIGWHIMAIGGSRRSAY
ncbi:MAG: CoA transferase, partial [Frankia sp.]